MSKNKKTTRYLHLHRVPFILLWMATHAMGWAAVILVVLMMAMLDAVVSLDWLFGNDPTVFMGIIGLTVGIFTAWGQPWLVRQRSGLTLRFWRPLTIVSYAIGGIALTPFVNYYDQGITAVALSHFAWFLIPALLPALSLRRIVRGAWKWAAAGLGMALLITATYFIFPSVDSYADAHFHPFSMLLGTVAYSLGTGWLMVRLLSQSLVDEQLSANATVVANETTTSDNSRGYLHHVPYMLLWLMTQAVGWIFVILSFGLIWLPATLFPAFENMLYDIDAPIAMASFGFVYGLFSAWAQPWLMRLRTGQQVQYWRPLTVIATTLTALVGGILLHELPYNSPNLATAALVWLSAWFIAPTILQTWSLRKAGKNIWLWPLAGVTSAAVAIMIQNQVGDFFNYGSDDVVLYAMYSLGFGLLVQVILSGMMSLQILEAPDESDDNNDDKAAKAKSNLDAEQDEMSLGQALLSAEVDTPPRRLQADN